MAVYGGGGGGGGPGGILTFRHSQTAILVEHLLENHPEQQFSIVRAVKEQVRDSPPEEHSRRRSSASSKMSQISVKLEPRASGSKPVKRPTSSGKRADENLPDKRDFTERRPRGRKMFYKTSVATWRPARCQITCPQCGDRQYPTVRMSADRYSQSIYGATWIMTCWPFCFLPCLFTAPTKHHLHCSKCGAFLGLYNPNQEVVETNGRRKTSSSSSSHGNQRTSNICEERIEMV
ncbi:hypothetical protein RP20_CCG011150 [Aedes albopictus]|nr:hypothetical protein RP20_CCG011150 [Aedes albopictus]